MPIDVTVFIPKRLVDNLKWAEQLVNSLERTKQAESLGLSHPSPEWFELEATHKSELRQAQEAISNKVLAQLLNWSGEEKN